MSLAEFLIGRHSSRADIAAETPIFHALAAADTPIFYALTTDHDASDRPATRNAALQSVPDFHNDSLTAPIPLAAYTQSRTAVPETTESSRPAPWLVDVPGMLRAHRAGPEQPRRSGRHRLLSPTPA